MSFPARPENLPFCERVNKILTLNETQHHFPEAAFCQLAAAKVQKPLSACGFSLCQ
jgi:hypothetical protein